MSSEFDDDDMEGISSDGSESDVQEEPPGVVSSVVILKVLSCATFLNGEVGCLLRSGPS